MADSVNSFLCRRVVPVVVLLLLILGSDGLSTQAEEIPAKFIVPGADFGKQARLMHKNSEFDQLIVSSYDPAVAITLPMTGSSNVDLVATKWAPFIAQLATVLNVFDINVFYIPTESELGLALTNHGQAEALVLFFNGHHELTTDGQNIHKPPSSFRGDLGVVSLSQWVLSSLSHEHMERVENDASMQYYFSKFPKYPRMPRVLYFSKTNFTHPAYTVLSQKYYADAVFGVVLNALETPEKRAIAERYNIRSEEDLPAVLALFPQPPNASGVVEDEVHFMFPLTNTTRGPALGIFVAEQLTDSVSATRFLSPSQAERRKYVLIESDRIRAESRRAIYSSAVRIPLVDNNEDFRKMCLGIQSGQVCVVLFVKDRTESRAPVVLRDALVRIFMAFPAMLQSVVSLAVEDVNSQQVKSFFDIPASSSPALVLISQRKHSSYYVFHGATWTEDTVHEFLSGGIDDNFEQKGKRLDLSYVPALSAVDIDDDL